MRSVCSKTELNYILKSKAYIEQIIKKVNKESEIKLLSQYSRVSRRLLRGWFDEAEEFLLYCKQNFNIDKLLKNIKFDQDQENRYYERIECRYNLLIQLMDYDFNKIIFHQDLILYGVGKIGKYFYEQIKTKCSIRYFIHRRFRGYYRQYSYCLDE